MKALIVTIGLLAISQLGTQASVIITEAMANSSHPSGGTGDGDWFEIYNSSTTTPININNWSWDDESNDPTIYAFPNITLPAGGMVLVVNENELNIANWAVGTWGFTLDGTYAGPGLRTTTGVYVLTSTLIGGFAQLASAGEMMYLYDSADTVVASFFTGNQSVSGGRSFATDLNGTNPALSVNGQLGAFTAVGNGSGGAGTDVGSPGVVAIPEPSVSLLAGFGLLTLLRRRRAA